MSRIQHGKLCSSLLVALTVLACGCHIPNKAYRDVTPVIAVPAPPKLPLAHGEKWPPADVACDDKHLLEKPCLAFLEFDDFGEIWQKNPSGRPTQLSKAIALIREARKQDPSGQPLILTFIHGWKHNASGGTKPGDEDPNIVGVESVLNTLHEKYLLEDKDKQKGHVVIGIYIAWRGGLVSPYWPVRQQFTYWNREATAARVGNTSMTDALIEISDTAHEPVNCGPDDACHGDPCAQAWSNRSLTAIEPSKSCSPLLLYIGHSFGALVLERALSQATITRMEREYHESVINRAADSSPVIHIEPLADLVIYVNSAAAATESKQVMDYLAFSEFRYRPTSTGVDMPLFLSVTSEADLATGLALKIGHAVPLLGFKVNGSMRGKSSAARDPGKSTTAYSRVCFDPSQSERSSIRTDLSQSDYFMSTTAHKAELWSHTVTTPKPVPGQQNNPADHCDLSSATNTFATCHIGGQDYQIQTAPNRCNGTPYWAVQVQKELIPDHGTIFTERLITFLMPFIPSPQEAGQATRPLLTRPAEKE